MKTILKLLIVILLVATISLTCFVFADTNSTMEELDALIQSMDFPDTYTTRKLPDLSGNIYYLIEFEEIGYAIYHPTANVFSEYSLTSESPYHNIENIVYGGPTYYFEKNSDCLINTVTGEVFDNQVTTSARLKLLTANDMLTKTYQSFDKKTTKDTVMPYADSSYFLPYAYYFQKLNNFGINTQGSCGYLAASIFLSYYANFYNVNFVPKNYITPRNGTTANFQQWDNMPSLSNGLHQELISIGASLNIGLATTGSSIKRVLSQYYSNYTIGGITQGVMTSPFFIDTQMRNILLSNRPLIMFGNLSLPGGDKGNHAVVCYGYQILSNITYYRVHMGYSGHTSVNLANQWSQNVFGQIYCNAYNGPHVHSANFIVNGVAYCGCGQISN